MASSTTGETGPCAGTQNIVIFVPSYVTFIEDKAVGTLNGESISLDRFSICPDAHHAYLSSTFRIDTALRSLACHAVRYRDSLTSGVARHNSDHHLSLDDSPLIVALISILTALFLRLHSNKLDHDRINVPVEYLGYLADHHWTPR